MQADDLDGMDVESLSDTSTSLMQYKARPQVMMELGGKRKGQVTIAAVDNRPMSWAVISTVAC